MSSPREIEGSLTGDPSIRFDHDRSRRIGLPEAIFCSGKTVAQCVGLVEELLGREVGGDGGPAGPAGGDAIVATRTTPEQHRALSRLSPVAATGSTLTWRHRRPSGATVAIVSAGTSDLAVAEEARLTLEALGHGTVRRTDVGVAGLHRLLEVLPDLGPADLIVAIAGMEGALPTVLAGLVPQPIVAVPTSVGYGASFGGATALLSMMASCAPGVATVGIDNGYGAACVAHRMLGLRR